MFNYYSTPLKKGNSCFCDGLSTSCLMAGLKDAQKLVARMQKEHPDVDITVGELDDHLNENAYIVPGLGDAGDRIFGTK